MAEPALVVANELRAIVVLLTHNPAGFINIAEPHTWRGHGEEADLGPVSIHGSDVFNRVVRLVRFMTLDRTDCIPLRELLLPGWGYHMMVNIDPSRVAFRLGKTSGTP
jgi:hypothetical protein